MEEINVNIKNYRDAVQLLLDLKCGDKEYLEKVCAKFEEMDKSMAIKILISSYEIMFDHSRKQEEVVASLKSIHG